MTDQLKFGLFVPRSRYIRHIIEEAHDLEVTSASMEQLAGIASLIKSGRASTADLLALLGADAETLFAEHGWLELFILDEFRKANVYDVSVPMLRMDIRGIKCARDRKRAGVPSGMLALVPA